MASFHVLLWRLRRTIREWQSNRRDERLFIRFLRSPSDRHALPGSASSISPEASLFVLLLERFIHSEMDTIEVRCTHELTGGDFRTGNLPSNLASRCTDLMLAARDGKSKGWFDFVTDKGPIPVYVSLFRSLPHVELLPKTDPREDEQASIREMDEAFNKLSEATKLVMTLSKSPLPIP